MSEVIDKKWYVVRAISGQENKIKTFIDNEVKRLNLSNFVEEVIVPTQKVVQIRNGKKVSKEKVYFPGEYFLRGSPETEAERNENESPQHKVNLNPFYMSKYLITQEQYQVIMDEDP